MATEQLVRSTPITDREALKHAYDARFRDDALITIVAIAHAESALVPDARLVNVDGSVDRGILQVNDHWHPEVTTACADDPGCAFKAGFAISSQGTNFTPWVTYNQGAHRQFVAQVRAAWEKMGTIIHLNYPFVLPNGVDPKTRVTQEFGVDNPEWEPLIRRLDDGSLTFRPDAGGVAGHWHAGIDYGLREGHELKAPADGTVVGAGPDNTGFGNRVDIQHEAGIFTLYGHLQDIRCQQGDRLTRGQFFGTVGNTGNSTGPHLHWGVYKVVDGWKRYLNPGPFLKEGPAASIGGIYFLKFSVKPQKDNNPVQAFDGPCTHLVRLKEVQNEETLDCDAWMYGESRFDWTIKKQDARWYHLTTGGWVASARVLGDAPGSTPRPSNLPAPSLLEGVERN